MARKTNVDSVRKYGGKAGGKVYRKPRKIVDSEFFSVMVTLERGAFIWDVAPRRLIIRGAVCTIEAGIMTVYPVYAPANLYSWMVEQHIANMIPFVDTMSIDMSDNEDIPF